MKKTMLNIFIGTENDQLIPQKILEFSILQNASSSVKVHCIKQKFRRVGGTNFGFVRFMVPELSNYSGKSIYLDADQIVFDDITKLVDFLDDSHDIALVKRPEGNFRNKPIQQINQTSVMVLNCERLQTWKSDTMFTHVVPNRNELQPGHIHYRDFMTLSWYDQEKIAELPPEWNHFNIYNDKTKLIHFSWVRGQPWKNPSHELTKLWEEWLAKAIKAGAVNRFELFKEVLRGAVSKKFLKYVFI